MNLNDQYIHHPRLGQVPTGGDRFGAILSASNRLHTLQQDAAEQARINASILRKAELRPLVTERNGGF